MRARNIPISDLPAELREKQPDPSPCDRCGKPIFWGQRAEGDERAVPVGAEPTNAGTLLISGFARNQRNKIVPRMSDPHNREVVVPVWDELPEWTRKKRWLNHAPLCAASLSGSLGQVFAPHQPIKRVAVSESRDTLVEELLLEIRRKRPTYVPSQRFERACAAYRGLRIDRERFMRELALEDERGRREH
jgi:hypothetical protein